MNCSSPLYSLSGHVPAARHFEWVEGVDRTSHDAFQPIEQLESRVAQLGLKKDVPVITYCQRGIRAAHTAFLLREVLGFKDVQIYEDSMLQYLNRGDSVVES